MKKVKITVLETTRNEALIAEYGVENLPACPFHKKGQVFYADYAKPEGFCDEAWKAIYQYAFALAHGAGQDVFYYGDLIRKPGVQRRPAPGSLQARGHGRGEPAGLILRPARRCSGRSRAAGSAPSTR